ncbi:HlyC/CorC family transporter [Inquilinus sp. CAU 1745]|uniref:HlyC/CorC family transporter n=1 Tax=Inquilinus sp. CAU 1745 TaxID=3140369 RepID=UPI00325B882A
MDVSIAISLALILACLLLSAFFSGSETALTAASRARMHQLENEGMGRASLVNLLRRDNEKLLGTLLLGNNLVNILASSVATSTLLVLVGEAAVPVATLVMTLTILVFSEVLPKTYAIRHSESAALAVAPFLRPLILLLSPLVSLINLIVRLILRLFGAHGSGMAVGSHIEELRGAIELHRGPEQETQHERAMLRSILDLGDVEVSEIMIHRRNVATIDADEPVADIVRAVLESPFTRIPVWRGDPDNIVGILHAKDLLRALQQREGRVEGLDVLEIAGKPWFIPDSTTLLDQLQAFRDRREHFAMVVDEYGSLQGVVTLEDILEEIVGDITDEHDVQVAGVRPQPVGDFIIDGTVTLRDLNRQFEWRLPDDHASTLAGLVLHEARRIPEVGQTFTFYGFRFEILRRQRNQIMSIRVTPPGEDAETEEPAEQG